MFRRVLQSSAKLVAGVGALQLGAAGVALTDKQLGKKPAWYQDAVKSLESSLKELGKSSYIESEEVLTHAEEVFTRVVDLDNPHILWRLGRTFAEKAEFVHDPVKKVELLKKAVELTNKAIQLEGSNGLSGAHKWYAISAARLLSVDKKAVKDPKHTQEQIWAHLKKATELNPKDAYAFLHLGIAHFEKKEYKEALAAFKKADELRQNTPQILFHLGEALRVSKQKQEAIDTLKKAVASYSRNKFDRKAKSDAKRVLLTSLKQTAEDITPHED
ncbi:unnamed protein product [Bursaphelenchus xylophilus]|uniref:(pine wood nematode) hypothetical protein n=1 Tax=Bursaphelenchus xylophilus TaxID=6326 RepID=A0A1I7S6N8_BURXY|nr:unnamed protein product [Bursaphelenchus xylophilus]CAG9120617.1 unnamed protein product [Bursaphelenchus xylophilus]